MKRLIFLISVLALLLSGCGRADQPAQIAATTLPVYEFTSRLCENTDLTVTRLVTESVSCLHDYSMNVRQVRAAEAAELVVISGAGLEEFMEDALDAEKMTILTGSCSVFARRIPEFRSEQDTSGYRNIHQSSVPGCP